MSFARKGLEINEMDVDGRVDVCLDLPIYNKKMFTSCTSDAALAWKKLSH